MPKLLTKAQVAEAIGVHPNTVDNLRDRDPFFPTPKRLPGGRKLLWAEADLDSWIDTLDATGER